MLLLITLSPFILTINPAIIKTPFELMDNVPHNNMAMFFHPTKVNEVLCMIAELKRCRAEAGCRTFFSPDN